MKFVQNIFDLLRRKKNIIFINNEEYSKFYVSNFFVKYKILLTIKKTHKKVIEGKPIKVALLMQYSSSTQFLPLFNLLLQDNHFDPYIIVNIDNYRDIKFTKEKYAECYNNLVNIYSKNRVLSSYNNTTNQTLDLLSGFDLILCSNPYDVMAHPIYQIVNMSKRGLPVLMSEYGYSGRTKYESQIYKLKSEKFIWKHYVENNFTKEYMQTFGITKDRIVVSGYSKMDPLFNKEKSSNNMSTKTIIIAPHHTIIPNSTIFLGSFLSYCDLLLDLPVIFPDISFIFRPHPLLKYELFKIWGQEKTINYYNIISSFSNVTYQSGGDYLDTFADSDAMIHDCGSFLAEYLYTDNPQCYLFSSKDDYNIKADQFLPLGKQMLNSIYKSYSHSDIIKFINMIKNEEDPKKQDRIKFAKENIRINYPNATQIMFEDIKNIYF